MLVNPIAYGGDVDEIRTGEPEGSRTTDIKSLRAYQQLLDSSEYATWEATQPRAFNEYVNYTWPTPSVAVDAHEQGKERMNRT